MATVKFDDLGLKLGNLVLAITLSTVPTVMTITFLGSHGFLLCRSLTSQVEKQISPVTKTTCFENNKTLIYRYTLFIWLFISIPTWRWFYINHARRIRN